MSRDTIRKAKVLKLYRFICAFLKVPKKEQLNKAEIRMLDSHEIQKAGEAILNAQPKWKIKKLEKFMGGALIG